MSSHEEDDQPLGISPTDTFFNDEYRKMMEGLTNESASLEDNQEETTPSSPKATPSSQEEDDNQETI